MHLSSLLLSLPVWFASCCLPLRVFAMHDMNGICTHTNVYDTYIDVSIDMSVFIYLNIHSDIQYYFCTWNAAKVC